MLIFLISIVVFFVILIVFGAHEEYKKAQASDDADAVQKFWRNVGISIIAIAVGTIGGIYYLDSQKESRGWQYHDAKTGREQIQYQGSQEQQQDLKAIDNYSSQHPDF